MTSAPGMDSYIVRIYRRSVIAGKEAAGLVERVGSEDRRAFANRDELWGFLAGRAGKARPRAKARRR